MSAYLEIILLYIGGKESILIESMKPLCEDIMMTVVSILNVMIYYVFIDNVAVADMHMKAIMATTYANIQYRYTKGALVQPTPAMKIKQIFRLQLCIIDPRHKMGYIHGN